MTSASFWSVCSSKRMWKKYFEGLLFYLYAKILAEVALFSTGLLNAGKFCVLLSLIILAMFDSLLEGRVSRSGIFGLTLPRAGWKQQQPVFWHLRRCWRGKVLVFSFQTHPPREGEYEPSFVGGWGTEQLCLQGAVCSERTKSQVTSH